MTEKPKTTLFFLNRSWGYPPTLALTDLDNGTQPSSALFHRYLRRWEPVTERFDAAIRRWQDIGPYLLGAAPRCGVYLLRGRQHWSTLRVDEHTRVIWMTAAERWNFTAETLGTLGLTIESAVYLRAQSCKRGRHKRKRT